LQRYCLRGAAPPRRRLEKLATESLSLDLALLDVARCRQCGRNETHGEHGSDKPKLAVFNPVREKVRDHVADGTTRTFRDVCYLAAFGGKADISPC
jgi:hypothetical protein